MISRNLDSYRAKRDFEATPEPSGHGDPDGESQRFVVHEHHARRLHWDLRLEHAGALESWAIPRGIPEDPKSNRLAVHVEPHPLSYIDFAGEIPAGSYGAGKVRIWDSGTYECHKFRVDEVIVTFHGQRLSGKYALFQTKGNDWMIHRMDPPLDPDRESMPERIVPMLATVGPLPADDESYGYEIKWDGVRAIAYCEGGRLRLESRNQRDITARYPELRALAAELGARSAVLDGEVTAIDGDGRPDFGRLQGRMQLGSESAVRRKMKDVPVTYIVFDMLYLDGRSTMALPYRERRRRLEQLDLAGPAWRTPAYHVGDGPAIVRASRAQGLEGVIAKRLDSRYEPGRRSSAWIKVKNQQRQELVIGGWLPGAGSRAGRIGALLAGYHDISAADAAELGRPQRLLYAGSVGSGFSEDDLSRLAVVLEPLRREATPFADRQPPRGAAFVEPRLVAEVEFSEWTRAGSLRHPSFKGLRDDKDAADVVREQPTDS